MSQQDIVIVAAARTAIGKFGGTLAKTPASELGAAVIQDLLRRTGLSGEQIGEVILGQVLTAGVGQNPARQAVIKSGLPQAVPAMTINKVCGSGLKAVMLAAQAIRDGDSEIVIAGGQESMSLSPHVLPNSRDGQRMGDWKMVDKKYLYNLSNDRTEINDLSATNPEKFDEMMKLWAKVDGELNGGKGAGKGGGKKGKKRKK